MVKVEVVFVTAHQAVFHRHITLNFGATVSKAIQLSNLYTEYPEAAAYPLGIFAKAVTLETPLKQGDRIEVYRPLSCDPKTRRRERAKQ